MVRYGGFCCYHSINLRNFQCLGRVWRGRSGASGLGNLIDVRGSVFLEFCDFGLGSLALLGVEIWVVLCSHTVKMPQGRELGEGMGHEGVELWSWEFNRC